MPRTAIKPQKGGFQQDRDKRIADSEKAEQARQAELAKQAGQAGQSATDQKGGD